MNADPILTEPRFVDRLDTLVRKTASPRAFAAAGRALEAAVLATRGAGALPERFVALAEAMAGSLLLVQTRTLEETDADFRVELAAAAAVLSVVRPAGRAACDGAIRGWLELGMSPPTFMTDRHRLARRALLALHVDDVEQAAGAVAQHGPQGVGGVLYDWVVVRRQRHGASRELECWSNLWIALRDAPRREQAGLVLLAALVAWGRTGAPRGRLLAWLDEVVGPLASETAERVAV